MRSMLEVGDEYMGEFYSKLKNFCHEENYFLGFGFTAHLPLCTCHGLLYKWIVTPNWHFYSLTSLLFRAFVNL